MVVYRQSRRRRITMFLIVVTSLALISLDQAGAGVVASLRTAAQDVVAPIQSLADDVINPITDFFDSLGRADELEAENQKLRRELAAAQGAVAEGQAATRRLAEFQDLLDIPEIADYDGIVASVVDGPIGNYTRTLQLDKGSDSGIRVGMPVVVADGLVGKVVSVSSTRSTVLRLDDPEFGVAVQMLEPDRVGPQAVAQGQKSSTLLRLTTLESTETLTKGELAITSGSARSLFPRGLQVGTVVRTVDAATATQQEAELRPLVDLDRLDLVKVLRYQPPAP
ncbi:MAG: rod shape-determining protein MreC [Acidimicrobiia bacterium]